MFFSTPKPLDFVGDLNYERSPLNPTAFTDCVASVMIHVATDPDFDLNLEAKQHERIVQAFQSGNKRKAANITRGVLSVFRKQGQELTERLAKTRVS